MEWKELFNGYVGKGNRTGKGDIDGTEIYDGDILKFVDLERYPHQIDPYCVVWSDDGAGFVCESSTNFMLACEWNKMKVIGNMRCNPELMGYKK